MVDFPTAENEADFVEAVRDIFTSYVPESDAWADPEFFSISSIVVGGLAWSAVNEARRGFDMRANLQTAQAPHLDLLAVVPPLNLTRRTATVSEGFASVTDWAGASIPAGEIFTTAGGIAFRVTQATLVTAGAGVVPVQSVLTGSANNSRVTQPLRGLGDSKAMSLGIYGAFDTENDDQFRARIYAEKARYAFFGSACSYERMVFGVPGVTRAWAVQDGATAKLLFLMEDKYPCGIPLPVDIQAVRDYFSDPCLTNLFFCLAIESACSASVDVSVEWATPPDDICAVEAEFETWLRANYGIGEGVRACDIVDYFLGAYPENIPVVDCKEDFPPIPCCVYNCAEITPAC